MGLVIQTDQIKNFIFLCAGNTVFLIPDLKIAYMADIVTPKRLVFALTTIAAMYQAIFKHYSLKQFVLKKQALCLKVKLNRKHIVNTKI